MERNCAKTCTNWRLGSKTHDLNFMNCIPSILRLIQHWSDVVPSRTGQCFPEHSNLNHLNRITAYG